MNSARKEDGLFLVETTAAFLIGEEPLLGRRIGLVVVHDTIKRRNSYEFKFSALHTMVNSFLMEVDIGLRRKLVFVKHHLVEGFLVAERESERKVSRLVLSVSKVVVKLQNELGALIILVPPVVDFLN
jgi:hypothetical protein